MSTEVYFTVFKDQINGDVGVSLCIDEFAEIIEDNRSKALQAGKENVCFGTSVHEGTLTEGRTHISTVPVIFTDDEHYMFSLLIDIDRDKSSDGSCPESDYGQDVFDKIFLAGVKAGMEMSRKT